VWEWCADPYARYPGDALGQGATANTRVVRGGAYYNFAAWCRSARRASVGQSSGAGHVGFRVAADWPFVPPHPPAPSPPGGRGGGRCPAPPLPPVGEGAGG